MILKIFIGGYFVKKLLPKIWNEKKISDTVKSSKIKERIFIAAGFSFKSSSLC